MRPRDRQFPSRCPKCNRLLADSGDRHCPSKTNLHCPWLRCRCGTNIRQSIT